MYRPSSRFILYRNFSVIIFWLFSFLSRRENHKFFPIYVRKASNLFWPCVSLLKETLCDMLCNYYPERKKTCIVFLYWMKSCVSCLYTIFAFLLASLFWQYCLLLVKEILWNNLCDHYRIERKNIITFAYSLHFIMLCICYPINLTVLCIVLEGNSNAKTIHQLYNTFFFQ